MGWVAGCTALPGLLGPGERAPEAVLAPVTSPAPRPAARAIAVTSPGASALGQFYARLEAEYRNRGLLRTDDGSRDAPVSASRLAAVWVEVALRDEHAGGPVPAPAPLRRFTGPVTLQLEFGPSVPAAVRAADRAQVAALSARLSAAARHPVRLLPEGAAGGNFHVLVLTEDERRAAAPRLAALVPGIDQGAIRLITDMPRDVFCLALSFARAGGAALTEAVAVVRAEHPDLTRLACYHEEIAQGMGLAADSPRARPSVFNDDQEFALLTALDLLMLRLHYDPRLNPGQREREAAPIALAIASELAAGES
jgi:hypothetical protein